MNSTQFETFIAMLSETLQADPDVLGLVLLGSTADRAFRDDWSDHDLWVVTRAGQQDKFLDDLFWLPGGDQLLIRARHSSGYSALYPDGHLIEFAVFDPAEVAKATVTSYRVVFDRGGVGVAVRQAHERTQHAAFDDDRGAFYFANFLILLRTAVARWQRGERLSARRYLSQFAMDALLRAALGRTPGADAHEARDPLDPRRRIERVLPELSSAMDGLEGRPVPEAAVALLDLAKESLTPHWSAYPKFEADAVRAMLTRADTEAEHSRDDGS